MPELEQNIGLSVRLANVFGTADPSSAHELIAAVDHNFNTVTGITEESNLPSYLALAGQCGVDAVLGHRDVLRDPDNLDIQVAGMSTILQVNAVIEDGFTRQLVYTPEQAVLIAGRLNASLVAYQANFGAPDQARILRDLQRTSEAARDQGFGTLVHTYLQRYKGDECKDLSPAEYSETLDDAIAGAISHGANVVKIAFRDEPTFRHAVEVAHDLGALIVMAGGEYTSIATLTKNAISGMRSNGNGVVAGRNAKDRPLTDASQIDNLQLFGPDGLSCSDDITGSPDFPIVRGSAETVLKALHATVHKGIANSGCFL